MSQLLHNKVFISTRPLQTSDELTTLLTNAGATVIEFPMISIGASQLSEHEKNHFSRLDTFQWIIFTSPNGVRYFFKYLNSIKDNYQLPEKMQIAVIGNSTKHTLETFGHKTSFINPGSTAEDFSGAFSLHLKNSPIKPNILLPLGNLARTVIQDRLKETANCFRINIYSTKPPEKPEKKIVTRIEKNNYDMIIFTSPSGIQNFLKISPKFRDQNIRMACIGPTTFNTAKENGFHPIVLAQNSSAYTLFESILNHYI